MSGPQASVPQASLEVSDPVEPQEAPQDSAAASADAVASANGEQPAVKLAQPEAESGFQAVEQFADFPVVQEVRDAITAMGFEKPSDVQAHVVAPAVAGRDLVVQSKTGSGKTAAFGIPIIHGIAPGSGAAGAPKALILVPTRELAHQVAAELKSLAAKRDTKMLAVYGGVSLGRQAAALKQGADVVVGTPGRLLDHIRRGNLSLDAIDVAVLDEADEMLSMGFWDDVTDLLKKSNPKRQTMLFSATLPYDVAKAAAQYLRDPVRIDVSQDELTVEGIHNSIVHVSHTMPKPRQLLFLLEMVKPSNAIIFCNTRNETEMIAKYLTQSGFIAEALSGRFRQTERERVMGRIKSGDLRYMVATDIAARGVDISDLSHVFNYALPEFSEVYLHRVGRTGRAGKVGTALSMVDGKGLSTLSVLEKEFRIHFEEVTLPPEDEVMRLRSERIMKDLAEKASVAEVGQHLPVAQEILGAGDGQQIVAFLLKAYFQSQTQPSSEARGKGEGRERERSRDRDRDRDRDRGRGDRQERSARGGRGERSERGERSDDAQRDEEGGRRRRRRRRRRRGRGGDGESNEQPSLEGRETMDMAEALAGGGGGDAATDKGEGEGAREGGNERSGKKAAPAQDSDQARLRVNIGFDDGFKGRGAVAKKLCALAGFNEGTLTEVEARRGYTVLRVKADLAELVIERVDGAQIGKKTLTVRNQG